MCRLLKSGRPDELGVAKERSSIPLQDGVLLGEMKWFLVGGLGVVGEKGMNDGMPGERGGVCFCESCAVSV